jgi:hypothetical protein
VKYFMIVCVFVLSFVTSGFAEQLPDEEPPNFTKPQQVIKSIEQMKKNLRKGIRSDTIETGSAYGIVDYCHEKRTDLRSSALKGSYHAEQGETKWGECYDAYRDVR